MSEQNNENVAETAQESSVQQQVGGEESKNGSVKVENDDTGANATDSRVSNKT
jgi:hypothetical protein